MVAVGDSVHVTREAQQLEGVVAFLGSVSFAKGDDWIGVRLTGASVGMGKNDGSVQGQRYFDSPPDCGIFVKKSAVTKRTLTRLEELRLRRELAQGPGDASSAAPAASAAATPSSTPSKGTATPRTPASTARTTGLKTPSAVSSTPTGVSSASVNRLEELRQRRAALQGRGPATGDSAGAAAGSSAGSGSASGSPEETEELKKQVEDLTNQLKTKENNLDAMQQQLTSSETKLQDQGKKIQELEDLVKQHQAAAASADADDKIPTISRSGSTATVGDSSQVQQMENQMDQLKSETETAAKQAQQEMDKLQAIIKKQSVELTAAQTEAEELQKELANLSDQAEIRGASDTSHYKERAKLQGEVASLNRRVEQLELDKQELENNVEDLALDKEQLQEEKEGLEDRLEELKLDAETAQMEVEELRMELEDAQTASAAALNIAPTGDGGHSKTTEEAGADSTGDDDAEGNAQDMAHSLNIQNARLREALIRLREQSAVEKMELSRTVRTIEKELEEVKALAGEVDTARAAKSEYEEQISDLKDMVEQGSAYEVMVEDLSDRVLSLEEELVASQAMIREMEEAADITAEMDEVQTDEIKALARELEDRDTVIRNLEEAIKMQRKREEDFQKTVSNYRNMTEKLKQEKKALLELQQGGEGEKSDLVSASQKALARAAQLVQDAAEMRKREAQAAIDRIDSQVRMHLCDRLEILLPQVVASSEIASIKGELLLSKVVGKASLSLDGIARSFQKTVRARAWEWRTKNKGGEEQERTMLEEPFLLSDDMQQMAATMIHQSEVAHVAIDVSGDLLWLLSCGQWPDILTPEASAELGAIMGHCMTDMDVVLGNVLNTLKEEGVLSPHQSNIGAFRQTVVSTMQTLRSYIEQDGESLVPMDWKPPALRLFRDTSRAKFSSLGCYAAVASILNHGEMSKAGGDGARTLAKVLRPLLQKLDTAGAEATKSCLRLAQLDVQDEATVHGIASIADAWRAASDNLLGNIYNMLLSEGGLEAENLESCEASTDEVVRLVAQFASALRSANLYSAEDNLFHPFSPEVADVWEGVTMLCRSIRAMDGDEDDINCLVRARYIEHALEDAIEKEPKLQLANNKISSLEKSLASRSKEIAMQNARLAELEKLLARTSAQPSHLLKSAQFTSSEEMNSLKEEIRVLTEAMDVVHRQVEEYESEIRFLKDAKSPKARVRSRTPQRHYTAPEDLQTGGANMGAFEAALFRPALHAARRDAARWKSQATISSLLELPPLHVPGVFNGSSEEEKHSDDLQTSPLLQLSAALAHYRMETASVKLIDLSKVGKSSRAMLHETLMKKASASNMLDKAAADARQWLESHEPYDAGDTVVGEDDFSGRPLVGRVTFAGQDPVRTIPTAANREDLYRLQLHVVQ